MLLFFFGKFLIRIDSLICIFVIFDYASQVIDCSTNFLLIAADPPPGPPSDRRSSNPYLAPPQIATKSVPYSNIITGEGITPQDSRIVGPKGSGPRSKGSTNRESAKPCRGSGPDTNDGKSPIFFDRAYRARMATHM